MNRNLLLFGLLVFLSSCTRNEVYYEFKELQDGEWPIDNVLHFQIDSADIDIHSTYDISVEITNNVNYPYQNLWLFIEYNENDSTKVKKQEEFTLADEFGKWRGSGFGSLFQTSYPVRKNFSFGVQKDYDFEVKHGMQDNVLKGIEKVGFKIIKSQSQ